MPERTQGRGSPQPLPKAAKSCSVAGCTNKYRCSGYCGYHYMRWFETGSPEPPAPKPAACSVDGCDLAPRSLGMCRKHYERVVRTGTTDDPKPPERKSGCLIDGCTHPRYGALGYCSIHYRRLKLYGDPLGVPEPRVFTCAVEGCDGTRQSPGMCKRHVKHVYYHRNIERMRERDRCRRSGAGADRRKLLRRAGYRADPEKYRAAQNAWRKANPEAARRADRRKRERHPESVRVRNQRRRAVKRNAPVNDLTAAQWRAIKTAYGQRCAYCHRRRKLTMDHVVPLSKGGSHTASNVVPACGPCNSAKNAGPAPTYQPLLM
jgi:5-methylcytosine-specific restriction endonuclease McrA